MSTVVIEAPSGRIGELRLRDLRERLGKPLKVGMMFRATIVSTDGETVTGLIGIVDMHGAQGGRCGMVCPECGEVKLVIIATNGSLSCRKCARQLTRHQHDKRTEDWKKRGGKIHDELVRLLRGGKLTDAGLARARALALQALQVNLEELGGVLPDAYAILHATGAG